MTSEKKLYDLTLVIEETCALPGLPSGKQLSQALPGCICSDLFVAGFSYKRLDLGSGLIAPDDESYRLLKRIKSANYIRDDLRSLSAQDLLQQLQAGSIRLQDGYIGHTYQVQLSLSPAPVPDSDKLFGYELQAKTAFRCFVLTNTPKIPSKFLLGGAIFSITAIKPLIQDTTKPGVLQSTLPVVSSPRVDPNSRSRFKLSYDTDSRCTVLTAGSLICPPDYFGDGLIL